MSVLAFVIHTCTMNIIHNKISKKRLSLAWIGKDFSSLQGRDLPSGVGQPPSCISSRTPFIHSSIHLCTHLSIYLSIHLSICLRCIHSYLIHHTSIWFFLIFHFISDIHTYTYLPIHWSVSFILINMIAPNTGLHTHTYIHIRQYVYAPPPRPDPPLLIN